MSTSSDAIIALVQTARGQRPYSMQDQEVEQCFNVTLALAVELIASNDRIDRLERQLAELSGKSLQDVRSGADDSEADDQRQASTEATLTRLLRILIDPRPVVDQRPQARTQG